MSILRKTAVFCIFSLLAIGLFLTCDDPNFPNPFSNNLGEKVVVEPPTIDEISPVSGSYLRGVVTFTGKAKAYIRVDKVEVYIYEDKENGQREVKWTDRGIQLTGGLKQKTMSYAFDTSKYNNWDFDKKMEVSPKDGPIRMKFRIFDSSGRPIESIELVYIIKNNPSVIKMASPSDTDVSYPTKISKVQWGSDIRGQVIDRRGLRPGFPQIKLWEEGQDEPGDEGWATLFLSGYDDMEKEGGDVTKFPAGPGRYADRRTQRVVNAASFGLRLAKYDIVVDPENPDLRKIQYKIEGGRHVLYEAGKILNFRIKTKDVAPDPLKGSIPSVDPDPIDPNDPPWIEGFFPPLNFGSPNVDNFTPRAEPVKILVFNSDMRPTVEINNDDILKEVLDAKPNIYITEAISKKIAVTAKPAMNPDLFRLRLFVYFEKSGELEKASLECRHESTGRSFVPSWDTPDGVAYSKNNPAAAPFEGTLFTFTAKADPDSNGNPSFFYSSSEPYILVFKVWVKGSNPDEFLEYRYVVYMDGAPPNVNIRSVQGAFENPQSAAAPVTGGLVNKSPYIVNGNIQVVVDRTDESGIMPFRLASDLGQSPPEPDNYPMVKWIVEDVDPFQADGTTVKPDTVLWRLQEYKNNPTWDNLNFFKYIEDTQTSSLTALTSGWVRRPLPDADVKLDADKANHFKLNTSRWGKAGADGNPNPEDLWLYVIAMDQVQNLGFIAQKIRVDQSTDEPVPGSQPLGLKNAGDKDIAGPAGLDVTVTVNTANNARTMTGNWKDGKKNNILGGNDSISLSFFDDDGIDLDSGGVTITLTDLNTPPAPKSPVTLTAAQVKVLLSADNESSKREWSGTFTQTLMAAYLYGSGDTLKDGMYKIEFEVKDDVKKKVEITPNVNPGDKPESAFSGKKAFYFAVFNEFPEVKIINPDENAWGSDQPIPVHGTVKSRFTMQSAWITFTPNVAANPLSPTAPSLPINVTLTPVSGTTADPGTDASGYYNYTWKYNGDTGAVFHPKQANGEGYFTTDAYPMRSFTVEAYDRIGNLGSDIRTVQVDGEPPDVTLSEFNHGRPPEVEMVGGAPVSVTYVYGKVAFVVSASDANGMYEVDVNNVKMSGIKWWVFKSDDPDLLALPTLPTRSGPEPSWGTPFPTYGGMRFGGNFRFDQARDGGKFTGIIDTRKLTDKAEYKLFIIAMDKAGNTSRVVLEVDAAKKPTKTTARYETFKVDQSRDYPVVYENTFIPELNKVVGAGTPVIQGTVSDADLFNSLDTAKLNKYVEIRFPTVDPVTGQRNGWMAWIPISLQPTYNATAALGGIDPSGAIVFKFDPNNNAAVKTYLNSDGVKEYQIRVTDEPDGPATDEIKNGGKWYGKNPDYFMTVAPDNAFYPGYVYQKHDKVSIVFPMDKANPTNQNPSDTFKFFVDKTPPEIFFNLYDPTAGHENNIGSRPTFSDWEQLKKALTNTPKNGKGNYVKEYKLIDLTMSWTVTGATPFTKVILSSPPDPAIAGEYPWDLSAANWTSPVGTAGTDDARLKAIFDAAPQGLQIVSFEASDMVPLIGRASWIFAKDTQGPSIDFSNISRAVKRATPPAESAFPSSGTPPQPWPPNSTIWNSAWPGSWKTIIENWPSEYAFKKAADVISALNTEAERYKSPSTVIGDADNPPVIQGTFSDEYSSVRILVPANTPTYFYYRFKTRKGVLQDIPATFASNSGLSRVTLPISGWQDSANANNGFWIQKRINAPSGQNENAKTAGWEIILNAANGFNGTDGENWVDIRIADTAGNISEIFNVAFLVDRAPPKLGSYNLPLPNTQFNDKEFIVNGIDGYTAAAGDPAIPGPVPVDKRVFSAAGDNSATNANKTVFSVRGRVNDYNLSNLRVTLGQDGSTAYSVTASADIDLLKSSANTPTGSGNGVTLSDDAVIGTGDSPAQRRLSLTGPWQAGTNTAYTADSTGAPEWEWTFNILQKDVFALRAAAGNAADSARRYIRVTASDKAGKRVDPVDWYFYLDTKKPDIEFTNLEKGRTGTSPEGNIKLSGLVSDDTKVREIKYMIGRWDYKAKAWRWYKSTATGADIEKWVDTAPPARSAWPSAFDSHTSATNTALLPKPAPAMTMDFGISQLTLNAAGTSIFPANLFSTEGQYRIDLYITDWSLGKGNPHDTTNGNDNENDAKGFNDFDKSGVQYNPATGAGNVSGRVFYIDKEDPHLRWASTIEEKTYFRNNGSGQAVFGFIAGDGNTLKSWRAEVRENGVIYSISDGTVWQNNGTTPPAKTAIPEPKTVASTTTVPATVADNKISDVSIYDQYFEIMPFMTVTGTSAGNALDVGKNPLPTYSITITVTDGANRTSSITKQFTLDNTKPWFVQDKFNPLSYKFGTPGAPPTPEVIPVPGSNPAKTETRVYSYDAISGKLNIRGNTTDNSNQIKSIAYYVANRADTTDSGVAWAKFPKPEDITKWRYAGGTNDNAPNIMTGSDKKTPLVQLDEGTLFAWSILMPHTSLFLTGDADAKAYAQQTTTGGETLLGGTPAPYGKYRDVDPTTWVTTPAPGRDVPDLTFPDLANKKIYGGETVGLVTIYVRVEDAAGNVQYDLLKYWIWPEGDRPIVTAINNPDSKITTVQLLNGTIRLSGMAKDNERVKYVWFRVLDPDGNPYTNLSIPEWQDTEDGTPNGIPIGGNWSAKSKDQEPRDGSTIGSRKLPPSDTQPTPDPGWYMANGGHSRDVSWWASINTKGELDPTGTAERKKFTVEVRAQDVTFDELNDRWMPYEGGYMGMASAMDAKVSKVEAWVVKDAPVFKDQLIATGSSTAAEAPNPKLWKTINEISLSGVSSYKVTVTHNIGLSAVRWSPTQWFVEYENNDKNRPIAPGVFRANPNMDTINLLTSSTIGGTTYTPGTGQTIYLNKNGDGYLVAAKATALAAVNSGDSGMAVTVIVKSPAGWTPSSGTNPTDCDIFVDLNADVLLAKMQADDVLYGTDNAARKEQNQTKGSVRYPVYLSASEVSKATPLSRRDEALLPIDNLKPYGMYTLNRKPAGTAVTIGGEAGDDGPVYGIARVVMWFQRKGGDYVSWHHKKPPEATLPAVDGFETNNGSNGPKWWNDIKVGAGEVIPAGVSKPFIPTGETAATGGDYAIVIDTNSPSKGVARWGHTLPTGFADGGMGKIWYAEINSYGIESGPVELHYVVIDKAGNAQYYKERLIIMNNVAVIDRVKLATDIRHSSWTGMTPNMAANNFYATGKKYDDKAASNSTQILQNIRSKVQISEEADDIKTLKNDVKKGISDWVSFNAIGADKVIDFNVRNNLFALRVETTKGATSKPRNFRLEYVSGARLMSHDGPAGQKLTDMKAGRVYIINDRGTARWGAIGADGDDWKRGYAFIAAVDGRENNMDKITGTGSAWELNSGYPAIRQQANGSYSQTGIPLNLQLADATYTEANAGNAESAEFVYANSAFGTDTKTNNVERIVDYNGPVDMTFPPEGAWTTWTTANYSLFIIRVFDGPESDLFGDFAILRVRVNNDDRTIPFAQLYDINPKTEGQDRQNIPQTNGNNDLAKEKSRSLSPMFIGEGAGSNRTKGGLWNTASALGSVDKPGHIEPRVMGTGYTTAPYTNVVMTYNGTQVRQQHSLSSAQMGGAPTLADASVTVPFADPRGFFTADTVSGEVVLRGYAEDDQRVQRVDLVIGSETVTILNYPANPAPAAGTGSVAATEGDSANYVSPKTGLLTVPQAQSGNVYFTDTIDAYRHRVEWAYIWDTERVPASTMVGPVTVRAVAYIRDTATGSGVKNTFSGGITNDEGTNTATSLTTAAPGAPHVSTVEPKPASETDSKYRKYLIESTRPNTRPFNKDFQVGLYKYNSISFNLRPYITGFLRREDQFSHNTRSRQGRYMFYREEYAVVKGFNLGGVGSTTPTISINGTNINAVNVGSVNGGPTAANFGITTASNSRYRQFQVGTGVTTGSGMVVYTFNSQNAVNTGNGEAYTGSDRRKITAGTATVPIRPTYIQPWNVEYSANVDGSTLWDDFTQAHIWQSNANNNGGSTNGVDNGIFRNGGANMEVFDPAMSIDPETGILWSSHNEGGGNGGNSGSTKVSNNNGADAFVVAAFIDPIINSDIYISYRNSGFSGSNLTNSVWTASSIIGKPGGGLEWRYFGGIWLNGPGGGRVNHQFGADFSDNNVRDNYGFNATGSIASRGQYHGESTFYNSYPTGNTTLPDSGPALNQFKNPHIITYAPSDTVEHIHVSYYDTKDMSIKYRYNRRGEPGTVTGSGNNGSSTGLTNIPRGWTNLDGKFDLEDQNGASQAANWFGVATGSSNRIVNTSRPAIDAGEYNSIAVTSDGYPVVAYYDNTNQRLKLAVSNNTAPIAGSNWKIIDNIIPAAFKGTGQYVSMRIDTRTGTNQNRIHIAAMNSMNKSLVYISGFANFNSGTNAATFTGNSDGTGAPVVQVVDSVGSVGRWCAISLDSDGNPWISYQDESYQGSRDGIKLAYRNAARYYKGTNVKSQTFYPYQPDQDNDITNVSITGWEAMHVPTRFRVDNARSGMECYPTRNFTGTRTVASRDWRGAVGYLGENYFRAAYYIE